MKKILIINIFGIGDVLFTTPLISNLKSHTPDSFIGYIANKRAAAVLTGNPKVDKVFIYEKDDYTDLYRKSKIAFIKKLSTALAEIKKEKFDLVIDLSLHKHASFLMWLIGIKQRMGFNYKNRSPFLTKKIRLEGYEGKHVVDHYLSLLEEIGISAAHETLELFPSKADQKKAEDWLKNQGIRPGELIVGIVPGGGASWGKAATYKRWPAIKYAELADKMVEKFSAKIILMGDIFEQELCLQVKKAMRQKAFEVQGETTLGEFAALLAKCRLAIVNDGGPLHIAVAAGTKTVSIFGPVDDKVYGPFPSKGHAVVTSDVSCRPCYRRFRVADCEHHNCLNLININQVLEKVGQVL